MIYHNTKYVDFSKPVSLAGKLLVATPHMQEGDFSKTVVYIFQHNSDGATGIIVNRLLNGLTLKDILQQVDIMTHHFSEDNDILYGGPMDIRKGVVLHTLDYKLPTTDCLENYHGVTTTLDILKDLAKGDGPNKYCVILGYSSWSKKQLEEEIIQGFWFVSESTDNVIFDLHLDEKWSGALVHCGLKEDLFSLELGHA